MILTKGCVMTKIFSFWSRANCAKGFPEQKRLGNTALRLHDFIEISFIIPKQTSFKTSLAVGLSKQQQNLFLLEMIHVH